MKIFKNNKKLIIGLALLIISIIIKKIVIINFDYALWNCDPAPYCRYSIYHNFPIFTVVLIKLLPWLIIIGEIILICALGEKIINWIKKKKDKNK